jgi:hypothetical protein
MTRSLARAAKRVRQGSPSEAPSTPRVRAHRQRRRRGVFCVQVPMDKIAALVRMEYLPEARQQLHGLADHHERSVGDIVLHGLLNALRCNTACWGTYGN